MTATVQLVFRGEVLAGFDTGDVQRELGQLLRADEAQLKLLFSGRRAVLKRGLAPRDAARYVGHLAALGAQVHVEYEKPVAPPPPAAADTVSPSAVPDSGFASSTIYPVSGWPSILPPPEDDPPPPPVAPKPPAAPAVKVVPAVPVAPALAVAAAPAAEAEAETVVCPKCGERQSMRVLCRGCTTNLEMAFAALRETKAGRRAERQAARERRRRAGRGARAPAETAVNRGERSAWPIGFGFSGRVGRLASASTNLWLLAALLVLSTGFLKSPTWPRMLLLGVGLLAVFFFSMRLTVLRCHDCGRHGWWALFVLVPYAGSVASLLISFVPGEPYDNDYGPPPPKGSWPAFGVAVLVLALAGAMAVNAGLTFLERIAVEEQVDGDG